jgi:purine catabolism regulator
MLTIAEVLAMPVFAAGQVVAGKGGLRRRLQWVHLIDIPEMADWAQAGELLFTTAFGLRDRPELQSVLIPSLVERGVAGMVVGVGRYFQHIPHVMIYSADELDFPILTLPWEVPFVEVARAISERIIGEQYALLEHSARIHETLTKVVLLGADLNDLAEALVDLVKCSVTIEDAQFHLMASATSGGIDQARKESLAQSRTPPALLRELERRGILTELRETVRPLHVSPLPEQGLTLERIVAPIVAGQKTHGYVWLIVEDRPISALDMIAIEHAATVAALIILREKAIYETEQRLRSSLLDEILEGDSYLKTLLPEKARHFGYSLAQSQQVLIFRRKDDTSLSNFSLWVRQKTKEADLPGLVIERGENLVLLLQGSKTADGIRLAHALREKGEQEGYSFLVAVGRAYADWERLSESYEEARQALRIGPALLKKPVISFDALGFLPWLRHLPAEAHERNYFTQAIQYLIDDKRRGTELLETLEAYLDAGGNVQEAARRLFLHRNTVRQRLNQIETKCNVDLTDALTCLNLHIALKELKLRLDL